MSKHAPRRNDGELGARPAEVLRWEIQRLAYVYAGNPIFSTDLRRVRADFTARYPMTSVRAEVSA